MPTLNHSVNSPLLAPRNDDSDFVAHAKSFHQSAAMHAARMIKFQYTNESKKQFRRECVDHLKASLGVGGRP
jgi:hypothetical protein